MTQYYQLSTNYEAANNLLKQGVWLAVSLTENDVEDFYLVKHGLTVHDLDYYKRVNAEFILPIPDPTIELQHSLKLALDECDKLREKLNTVDDQQIQIEGRDAALKGGVETCKKLKNSIAILENNLTRSNSDRLSQLTAIMSMVQALEDKPQDKRQGAIYLIKRVLFEAICKLDPSQAIEL